MKSLNQAIKPITAKINSKEHIEVGGCDLVELAEKCGTVGSAIRKYESGKITPKIETLQRIAAALGVSVFAIYDAANPMINAMKALETANEIGNRLYDRQNQNQLVA